MKPKELLYSGERLGTDLYLPLFTSKRYKLHNSVIKSICLRGLGEVPDLRQMV